MRKPLALLALTTVVFAGTSVWLWREVGAQRAALATAQARIRVLQYASVGRTTVSTSQSLGDPAVTPVHTGSESAKTPPADAEAAKRAEIERINRGMQADQKARWRRMLGDKSVRAAQVEQQKLWLLRSYLELNALFGWDRATIERLAGLLAEQYVRGLENPTRVPEGEERFDPNAPPEWVRKGQQIERSNEAEVTALLGEAKAREWAEYRRTSSARDEARLLRNLLEGSAEPLEDQQMPGLVRALADEHQRYGDEFRKQNPIATIGPRDDAERIQMTERQLELDIRSNQRLHEAAAPYLSPPQLARYDEMLRLRLETARSRLRSLHASQSVEQADAPKP